MADSDPVRRPRNTTRQREAGAASREETRRRLVEAAGELFGELGYVRTTVSAVAARAGVSVQSLYLAVGGKRQLLEAHLRSALSGSPAGLDEQEYHRGLRAAIAARGGDPEDPQRWLSAFAAVFRDLAERAAGGWALYREAAASEPDVAADWAELTARRRRTIAFLLEGITGFGAPGSPSDRMVDTVWVVASPESYDLLVRQAGYTLDEYQAWVADTLVTALCRSTPAD